MTEEERQHIINHCYDLRTTYHETEKKLKIWKGEHYLGCVYVENSGEKRLRLDFPTNLAYSELMTLMNDWVFYFTPSKHADE